MGGEFVIGPFEAVVPVPLGADVAIEPAIHGDRAGMAMLEADVRAGRGGRPQPGRVVEREVGPDDLDATCRQMALMRARWRAAFARLPQVAMSHQRRAAFFVLS